MDLFIKAILFTALSFIILQYQDLGVSGQEKSCNSVVQDLTKKQLGGISACTKSMKFKNGKDKAKKSTCIMKCVLKKESFLDDKGQLTWDQFYKFQSIHFPVALHDKANATFRPCVEAAINGMDDSDEFCKDYDAMIKCLLGAFPNFCK